MFLKYTSTQRLIGILLTLALLFQLWLSCASRTEAGSNIIMRPPFNGTYRLTVFFDHSTPNYNTGDNQMIIYTGETGTNCAPHCYNGHPGVDWSMYTNTPVLAAADGTVEARVDSPNAGYGNRVVIRHDNGYRTLYAHFRIHDPDHGSPEFNVQVGQRVSAGDVIGWSGNTGNSTGAHLHFGVYRGQINANNIVEDLSTDPFGWRGTVADPLINFPQQGQGHTASCLWGGAPGDAISCADIIVEDDGAGWTQSPGPGDDACNDSANSWARCDQGNGFRYHWTNVWDPADYWVRWIPPLRYHGYYQVYAFVPGDTENNRANSNTTNARYQFRGGAVSPINQNANKNWVSLGARWLWKGTDYVELYDYTGEPNASRHIAADAIKFSASVYHLPRVSYKDTWVPSVIIRNPSGVSTVSVRVHYYNSDGLLVEYDEEMLDPHELAAASPSEGFSGSAVVVTDGDVAIIVREESGNELNEYNGIMSTGGSMGWEQTGTVLYAPIVKNSLYGRTSHIFVLNAGSAATTVEARVYNSNGAEVPGSPVWLNLAANQAQKVTLPAGQCGQNWCSARLSSNNGQALAAVVREQDDASTFNRATHNVFSAGTTHNYVPLVKKNAGGQTTNLAVQNLGSQATDISVTCYPIAGNSVTCGTRLAVPPLATVVLAMNGPDGANLVTGKQFTSQTVDAPL